MDREIPKAIFSQKMLLCAILFINLQQAKYTCTCIMPILHVNWYDYTNYLCCDKIVKVPFFQQENSPERVARSTSHSDEELLAQASCQALASQQDNYGRVYAVGRLCRKIAGSCNAICLSANLTRQDPQTAAHVWSAIGAFHIYYDRPSTTFGTVDNAMQGLKSVRTSTTYNGCGPNFCCCIASNSPSTCP